MKFSKKQLIIGIILLIIVAPCIIFFIGDTSSEEFTSLQSFYPDTKKTAPDQNSLYYLLYIKQQTSDSARIADISNNYLTSVGNLSKYVSSSRINTFKTDVQKILTDYKTNKDATKTVADLKTKYAKINSDTGNIGDSCMSTGTKASKSDWQKFANSIFTNSNFLSSALTPTSSNSKYYYNSYNIYISDDGYNKLLYDTTVSDAKKIINIANYINTSIPGTFEPISQKDKDAIKDEILNWNTNLRGDILSRFLTSGLNNNSGSISYSSALGGSSGYDVSTIYDLTYLTIVTSSDTPENIIQKVFDYVSPPPPPMGGNAITGNVITGNVITGNAINGNAINGNVYSLTNLLASNT
jgi:hypothetical protein